jgi:ribose/xylose/arabinose/galactoside ABC-type transport system permease subunit
VSAGAAPATTARAEERQSFAQAVRRYGIAVVFVALVAALCVVSEPFRTHQNAINLLRQNAIIGIMACGMTFAIVLGGFDLSVGAVAGASSVVAAKLIVGVGPGRFFSGADIAVGVIGCLLTGLVVGLFNGVLIAYVGVNPFVSTLGTMTIVRGLIFVWTNATPVFGVPLGFSEVGRGSTFGVPNPFWIFLGVALVLIVSLSQTKFGHYIYAIGGNASAARQMGIPVRRIRLLVYVITGVCAAVAGLILVGQTSSGQPTGATGYELTAIAAVVVGGASLNGGQGSIANTIVGVFLLGVVSNALNLLGVSPFWQPVATGTILVIAVAIDSAAARSVAAR